MDESGGMSRETTSLSGDAAGAGSVSQRVPGVGRRRDGGGDHHFIYPRYALQLPAQRGAGRALQRRLCPAENSH